MTSAHYRIEYIIALRAWMAGEIDYRELMGYWREWRAAWKGEQ
jgi:hypothetical protein